ncbi:MAG: AraC family transcriptional regulator [Lachnospiraceae bacterium]|nr:AraC family transcriptional regulator [Lachnospiraceae bacterium]
MPANFPLYQDLDISFPVFGAVFHAPKLSVARMEQMIPRHSHGAGCYEIHYISDGYGTLLTEGTAYRITPNTLFVTGPHVEHAQIPLANDPMREYCVYLKAGRRTSRSSDLLNLFTSTRFWFGSDSGQIPDIMEHLFDELAGQQIGWKTQVETLLAQLVVSLVRHYSQESVAAAPAGSGNLADSASLIIEEYFLYHYQDLSLEELSGMLGLSVRQTERYFAEHYGKTFLQKKIEARMSAAAVLLSDSSRSITSIADDLGYSCIEHFSAAFRRYYGVSAREFRKNLQKPVSNLPSSP